jgi:arylsulfatase
VEVDTKKIPHTIPFTMPFDETFDVGIDTRTGVNNADYYPPFRFTRRDQQAYVQDWAGAIHG